MSRRGSGAVEEQLARLPQTIRAARVRPHGRTQRFEDSFSPTDPTEVLSSHRRLELGDVLGEGGMGVVHRATQPVLDREVAVKTLREESRRSSSRFLQEARVSGLVEHPNVIPIYDLVATDDGAPALVMKRVSGVSWTRMLHEPELIPDEETADPLAWQLRTFSAVCDAVQYAHELGIIHRDIKPDNVMIGSLDEVYLLDWGLAVSMREEHAGYIPLAREAEGVVGTPAYMAPEMALADPAAIGPATDIYLLGATLHEIVTSKPPHTGANLYMVALQAIESTPKTYPSDVPSELAAICHRAMARDPNERFSSVAEMREAVADFVTHRESHALEESGRAALESLERRLSESPEAESAIEDLFGAVRFSFGQALELWPGNERARRDWQRALRAMARYELSRGRVASAAGLHAELAAPDDELAAALRDVRDQRGRYDEEVDQLRRLQREHDLGVSVVTRSRVAMALGVVWLTYHVGLGRLRAKGLIEHDVPELLASSPLALVLLLTLPLVGRGLLANEVNRRIYLAVTAGIGAAVYGRFVAFFYEQGVGLTFAREQIIYAMVTAFIAVIADLRILAGAAVLVVTAAASSRWPHLALELGGVGLFSTLSWMSFVWRRAR